MRAVAAIVLAALVGACSGDGTGGDASDGVVERDRPVPADVQAFLDRVIDPTDVAFTADYELLNKNGGGVHDLHVESEPPAVRVTIDGEPVDLEDQPALARFGIFAGFLAENPSAAIRAAAQREDAGDAVFTEPYGIECIAIPVQGVSTSTWCLSSRLGIFAYVDTPAVRYELVDLDVQRS